MTRKQMSMLITQTFAPTGIRTRDPKNVRQPHYRLRHSGRQIVFIIPYLKKITPPSKAISK